MNGITAIRWTGAGLLALALTTGRTQAADAFLALRVSAPLAASGSAGIRFDSEKNAGYQPALEAEVGLGGGRVLVGFDSLGRGFGLGLKAFLLRTWIGPIDVDANQTYLGMEAQVGYKRFFAEAGGARRMEGDGNDDWLLSVGLGFYL